KCCVPVPRRSARPTPAWGAGGPVSRLSPDARFRVPLLSTGFCSQPRFRPLSLVRRQAMLRTTHRRPTVRPRLEALEDRCVLSGNVLQTNLVSDLPGVAQFQDPHLVNPWGISESPASPFWVADNGMGVSTLYNSAGQPQTLVV